MLFCVVFCCLLFYVVVLLILVIIMLIFFAVSFLLFEISATSSIHDKHPIFNFSSPGMLIPRFDFFYIFPYFIHAKCIL